MTKQRQNKQKRGSRPISRSNTPAQQRPPYKPKDQGGFRNASRIITDEKSGTKPSARGAFWIFGRHAVLAAMANPARRIYRLIATSGQAREIDSAARRLSSGSRPSVEIAGATDFESLLPHDSVHQGIAAEVLPLPGLALEDICKIVTQKNSQEQEAAKTRPNLVLMLDQVTDPHNVGAIIRSAAAFGARALITTDRHAPPETGVLAKAASGTLEILPWVRVTNLARALDQLAEMGYWRVGLEGGATLTIDNVDLGPDIVLVLGAEGAGLRHGSVEHCDLTARLPMASNVESLNVSNAAAVALYALSRPHHH